MTIYFIQVSLKKNIPIIKINYLNIKKFYPQINIKIKIICKKKEEIVFKNKLKYSDIEIINEESILKLSSFKKYFLNNFYNKEFKKKISLRVGWYYQQALKIIFILIFLKKKNLKKLVLWDADTLILKKIDFFKNNYGINFGTVFEKNQHYFSSLLNLFKKLPSYYLSGTCQFVAITFKDANTLKKRLANFMHKKEKTSIWISKIMGKIISTSHNVYTNSLFSEQDLLTINKILNKKKKQELVLYFRNYNINGLFTNFQISTLQFFNFHHLTYDFYDKMKKKKIKNITFFLRLLKILFIFNFRKIKYIISCYNNKISI
jgi:hypothetical protein